MRTIDVTNPWIESRYKLLGDRRWILLLIAVSLSIIVCWMLFFRGENTQGEVTVISVQPLIKCIELSSNLEYRSMWVVTGSNGDVDLESIDRPCPTNAELVN